MGMAPATLITKTLITLSGNFTLRCMNQVSREEALLALKGLQSRKAQGPDGLSSEFYQEFKDVLVDPFLEILENSFITGSFPHSLREDIILILKFPHGLALLNQDIEILSKILELHLYQRGSDRLYQMLGGFCILSILVRHRKLIAWSFH